jgi:uncharacterized protein (TIGR02217 family)
MSFQESPRFPECISYHPVGGPVFSTDITVVESGFEYRNQTQEQALREYEVSHEALLQTDYDALNHFFHVRGGMHGGFRLKDWWDFTVSITQGVFDVIDSTHFQMMKLYTSGSNTYRRLIQKPIATVTVTGGVTPVVDYTTGIVAVASGTPTAWSGTFDVPCRFNTDAMKTEIKDRSSRSATAGQLIIGWDRIPIQEIRV